MDDTTEAPSPYDSYRLTALLEEYGKQLVAEELGNKPGALTLAILADLDGRGDSETIKRRAAGLVGGSLRVWWVAAKKQAQQAGWVRYKAPNRWSVDKWPDTEDLFSVELPAAVVSSWKAVQTRELSPAETHILEALAHHVLMSRSQQN